MKFLAGLFAGGALAVLYFSSLAVVDASTTTVNENEEDVKMAIKEEARSLWGSGGGRGEEAGRSDTEGSYYVRSERTDDTCGLECSTDRDCEVDCPTCVKSTTSTKYGVCGVIEEEKTEGRTDTTDPPLPTCGSKCSSDLDCSTNEENCTVCQKELNQNGKKKQFGVCAVEDTSSERVDVEETEVRSDEDNCGVRCVSNRDCGGSDNVCGICQKPANSNQWGSPSSSTGTCVADTNGQTWEVKDDEEQDNRPYYYYNNQNKWSHHWEYYNYYGTNSKSSGKYKYKGGSKYKYKSGGGKYKYGGRGGKYKYGGKY